MNPIVFCAKRSDTGEWIEGYPIELSNHVYLYYCACDSMLNKHEIIPDTLSACTGQRGEGDIPIFENDIVFDTYDNEFGVVEWDENNAQFVIRYQGITETFGIIDSRDLRTVGNIFDETQLVPWYFN